MLFAVDVNLRAGILSEQDSVVHLDVERGNLAIIIPDTAKEKPQEAEVIAVGPGKLNDEGKRSPMDVKAGDRILMGKYSGSEIKIDGQDYVILREDEILAVIES